jgi:diaminopimelate decarboxylase
VVPVRPAKGRPAQRCDVVGPVCESADFIARDRELAVEEGELLAVLGCGAYSACMASNYNARPRVAEVLIDGERMQEIRRRETIAELLAAQERLH